MDEAQNLQEFYVEGEIELTNSKLVDNKDAICILDILNFISNETNELQRSTASDGLPYFVGPNGSHTYLRYAVANEFDNKLKDIVEAKLSSVHVFGRLLKPNEPRQSILNMTSRLVKLLDFMV